MQLLRLVGGALLAASAVQAQGMATYTEPGTGVNYKIAFPEAEAAPFDLLLSVEAPINASYVGVAMGGCMLRSPILLVWPNGKSVTVSSRWAR
jgi:hypothetical protein